jgi:Xaa-Pro aminopeptidase
MSFQSFEPPATSSDDIRGRVAALRARFAGLGVDGVVIPHEDEYQSEYLPASEERLAFITGFTGSAGRAIVLNDRALFATDGRYTLQLERQVPGDLFHRVSEEKAARAWEEENLPGVRLGVDPRLHTRADLKRLGEIEGLTIVRLDGHPVDDVWTDRPAPPRGRVKAHPMALAGQSPAEKLAAVRAATKGDAVLVTASDAVSWLFNWRGADVAHTPLVLARAIVPKEGEAVVFVDPEKLPNDLAGELAGLARIAAPATFLSALEELAAGKRVVADPARSPDAALAAIEARGTLVEGVDPTMRLKAEKNAAEIAGVRAAHVRDGVAVTRFLAWFDDHAVGSTEIGLAERLEAFRREAGALDLSFDTIAGSGPNGAIVHYRVDRSTDRRVEAGDPVLLDSGAQYADGTTDVTRTMVAGTATDDFRVQFTRVLKGNIALARQRFPEGAMGAELDPLARAALWRAGHDYAHGTGHGIGAYLAVHEGPQGISKRGREPLATGMLVSNEPGDYRAGEWGIRIETVLLVREPRVPPGGLKPMHWFETLTLVPIDTRLVIPTLLTPDEIGWLDSYHARVHGALVGDLDAAERAWLATRCRPIGG